MIRVCFVALLLMLVYIHTQHASFLFMDFRLATIKFLGVGSPVVHRDYIDPTPGE